MYNDNHKIQANNIGAVQGDVPMLYVDELPKGVREIESRIVAFGEVTGHHHVVEDARMFTDEFGNLFALVERPTRLLHQEHSAIELHPGIVQFGMAGIHQVEYAGDEERAVRD